MSIPSPGKSCLMAATIAILVLQVQPVRGETEVALQSHSEQVEIVGRVAITTVSQTYVNYTDQGQEVVVVFNLPPGAAVHDLAMWVDGLRSPGVLHPRIAAKRIYREIVSGGRDPALLEYLGRGRWQLSVFPVLSRQTQKVEFRFTSLLGAQKGNCIYRGMKIIDGTFDQALGFEFSATARYKGGVSDVKAISDALGIQRRKGQIELGFRAEDRKLDKPVTFSITPRVKPTSVVPFKAPDGRKYYTTVLAPAWKAPKPEFTGRNMLVVLDVSASMKGPYFQTAARVVQAILDDMDDRDKFSVLVVGSDVAIFRKKLIPATKEDKSKAIKWLSGFMPKGATDLAAALRAIDSFNKNKKATLNVFMISDGRDCVGARRPKKKVSPFLTRPELPSRPPANSRFFICGVRDLPTVLEYLAESTHGLATYVYEKERKKIAAEVQYLLEESRIPDLPTRVTLRQIVSDGTKQPSGSKILEDIGFSRPDPVGGMVVSGPWPAPGKRTIEVVLQRGKKIQTSRHVLDFSKDIPAGQPDLRKIWAHQRANRMWDKLHRQDVKISEVRELMDFSQTEGIVTRAMALLVLESDEDYIRRGINRPGSAVPVKSSLFDVSAGRLLVKMIAKKRKERDRDFDPEPGADTFNVKHQAKELMRLGRVAAAVSLLNRVVASEPGQFEAQEQAALIGEYLALKGSFTADSIARKANDKVLNAILAGGDWHEIVMQSEPTSLTVGAEEKKTVTRRIKAVMGPTIQLTPEELRIEKLLACKIPKIEMKNAALKDVLARLETPKDNMDVRWTALAREGIKPSTPVSVALQNVTLEKALNTVLSKAAKLVKNEGDLWRRGLDFRADKNGITISSKRDLAPNGYLRTYDIQDMLTFFLGMESAYPVPLGKRRWYDRYDAIPRKKPDDVFQVLVGDSSGGPRTESVELVGRSFATASMGAVIFKVDPHWEENRSWRDEDARFAETGLFDPGAGGGSAGAGLDDSYPGDSYASELSGTLQDLVDRDSWVDAGGGVGSIQHVGGVLLINQTRANHKAIIKLLNNLRDAWRKRRPKKRSATDIAGDIMSGWEKPETPFTANGRIAEWIGDLLSRAATGKLSEFSSVRVKKTGSRTFARIYGIWFDTSLSGQCRILPVERGSAAHTELLHTDKTIEKCLALGRYVIVKADDSSAVYLNRDGISKADDKQLKKLIAALAKPPTKR